VYDIKRTFRVLVPQFAMYSSSVMYSILQLSAESSGMAVSPSGLHGGGASYMLAMSRQTVDESPSLALGVVAHFVLLRVKQFVQSVPETWLPSLHGEGKPRDLTRNDFAGVGHRQIWMATFALMARLGMLSLYEFASSWV